MAESGELADALSALDLQPAAVLAATSDVSTSDSDDGNEGGEAEVISPVAARHLRARQQVAESAKALLDPDDGTSWLHAVMALRKLVSTPDDPLIFAVLEHPGLLERLVELLSPQYDPTLIYETAWCLSNVASGSTEDTARLVEVGAVEPLVELLLLELSDDVTEQLGNIAGDSAVHRDAVFRAGALQPLLGLCVPGARVPLLRQATFCLRAMAGSKPLPPFEAVADAMPELARMLGMRDEETLTNVCWCLSSISEISAPAIDSLLELRLLPRCVTLLSHDALSVRRAALRILGNVVQGDDRCTQAALDAHALPKIVQMTTAPEKGVRKEAAHILSNVTAGSQAQIQQALDTGAFPALYAMIANPAEVQDVKDEASWALCNAVSGSNPSLLRRLINSHGLLAPLCSCLTLRSQKPRPRPPQSSRLQIELLESLQRVVESEAEWLGDRGDEVDSEVGDAVRRPWLTQVRASEVYAKTKKLAGGLHEAADEADEADEEDESEKEDERDVDDVAEVARFLLLTLDGEPEEQQDGRDQREASEEEGEQD